jgi:hypothetical protein
MPAQRRGTTMGTLSCHVKPYNTQLIRLTSAHIIFLVLSYWNRRNDHGNARESPSLAEVHVGHAIRVDAVAESYLNVGGICCLVL